jgi:hypothetical protein
MNTENTAIAQVRIYAPVRHDPDFSAFVWRGKQVDCKLPSQAK